MTLVLILSFLNQYSKLQALRVPSGSTLKRNFRLVKGF